MKPQVFISWVISSGAKHQPTCSGVRVGLSVHFLLGGTRHVSFKMCNSTLFLFDMLPLKIMSRFFFLNSCQCNLKKTHTKERVRSKEKRNHNHLSQCVPINKFSGHNNVGAREYISPYSLVTHSSMKCSDIIWMDSLWREDEKPHPYWHSVEDKLLGRVSRTSYTHMSTLMDFAINIFEFLPTCLCDAIIWKSGKWRLHSAFLQNVQKWH